MTATTASPLVERYRRKFGLSPSCPLDESMVMGHWELERQLARDLLSTPREDRWEVFENAYTTLYSRCPWLNEGVDESDHDDEVDFGHIRRLLGKPQDVYEVGSGKARLLGYLARHGFRCVATEITRERGERWLDRDATVTWRTSDGINLRNFEPADRYDAVISTHVVEHMHPEDVGAHLENVHAILKPGGRYIMATPHAHAGPMDLSEVFGLPKPICMHLKEYTWGELVTAMKDAGFPRVEAAYVVPRVVRRKLPLSFSSGAYLGYVRLVESTLGMLSDRPRQRIAKLGQLALFRPEILMVAHKA